MSSGCVAGAERNGKGGVYVAVTPSGILSIGFWTAVVGCSWRVAVRRWLILVVVWACAVLAFHKVVVVGVVGEYVLYNIARIWRRGIGQRSLPCVRKESTCNLRVMR